jgi:hypothetical protein
MAGKMTAYGGAGQIKRGYKTNAKSHPPENYEDLERNPSIIFHLDLHRWAELGGYSQNI